MNEQQKKDFLYSILHGHRDGFYICTIVSEALSYDKIPKSFWLEKGEIFEEIMGSCKIPKIDDINLLREELINLICDSLNHQKATESGKELYTDHYARLFHALAILGVPKDTELVPGIGHNFRYNAAYSIWALDDGSEKNWEVINNSMWYSAEAIKRHNSKKGSVLIGTRHKSN